MPKFDLKKIKIVVWKRVDWKQLKSDQKVAKLQFINLMFYFF